MQYELIFRGSLTKYRQVADAECIRYSRGDAHAKPLVISHPFKDRPPGEFEEVVLEFLDDYFRREPKPPRAPVPGVTWAQPPKFVFPPRVFHVPVTVRAESSSDGKLVKLTVRIEKEVYQESGKAALSRWRKIESAWQRKGWLADPLAQYQAKEKRGKYSETQPKLNQVRKLRWEHIKKKHEVPTKAYILSVAKISHATCKTHDPELWENWKDEDYE